MGLALFYWTIRSQRSTFDGEQAVSVGNKSRFDQLSPLWVLPWLRVTDYRVALTAHSTGLKFVGFHFVGIYLPLPHSQSALPSFSVDSTSKPLHQSGISGLSRLLGVGRYDVEQAYCSPLSAEVRSLENTEYIGLSTGRQGLNAREVLINLFAPQAIREQVREFATRSKVRQGNGRKELY